MDEMNRNGIRLVLLVVMGALSACSTTATKPSCPVPDGATCLSATEVYSRTNYSDSVSVPAESVEEEKVEVVAPTRVEPDPAPAPKTGPVGPVAYRPYQYARLETDGDTLVVTPPHKPVAAVAPLAPTAGITLQPVRPAARNMTTEPHREPARVMKIRIGAWEDENGSLHGRSDVFTEIEPRRWSVGSRAAQASPGFALLEGFGQGAAQDAQPATRAGAAGSRPGE